MSASTVSFISSSGGVGKTKLSLILSYYLRGLHEKVLLVDMDPTAGASLLLLSDEEYMKYVEDGKTLSSLMKRYLSKSEVEFDRAVVNVKMGDRFIDLLIPGDDFIEYVEKIWQTASPGPRFRKMFKYIIPLERYDFIIIDNAPFFDPRYTSLALYVSEKFFIPLRPSLVDLKRTLSMVEKIRDELTVALEIFSPKTDVGRFMEQNMNAVFNLVPSNPKTAEHVFVRNFLDIDHSLVGLHPDTRKRVQRLLTISTKLKNQISFLQSYIKTLAPIERFPTEVDGVLEKTGDFTREASRVLGLPVV